MTFITKLIKNEALMGTVIVSSGIFIGSIFAYLIQVFLGRSLSVEDYGIFNTLLSVGVIISVLNNTISTSIVKLVAGLKAISRFDTLTALFVKISTGSFFLGLLVFTIIFLSKNALSIFLNIHDTKIFDSFGLYLWVSFLSVVPLAYLQGFLRFKAFAFSTVAGHVLRLIAVVVGVSLGIGVRGVYKAMFVGGLGGYLIYLLLLKKNFSRFQPANLNPHYKKMLAFAGPVLFVQVGMILLNNVDIVLVKHYFDAYTAGLYSGLVTVAKVFLFGANTVAVVMFPQVSAAFSKGENVIEKMKPFLFIQLAVVVLGLMFFDLFPSQIVGIMFGGAYTAVISYLPKFAFFFALYVLINFMILFLLAVERTKVFFLQIPALFLQTILIALFHNDINAVVNANILVSLLLLVSVSIYAYSGRHVHINNSSGV